MDKTKNMYVLLLEMDLRNKESEIRNTISKNYL